MVAILPPDLSITFLAAVLVPLVIGIIVGLIIKSALKIGVAIAILIIILILLGVLTPNQVLMPLASLIKSGASSPTLKSEVQRLAGYIPYSSITFIIGLAIGFLKG
jgi:uncharacterized protein YqfA (UPF0365 family)